MLLGTNSTSLWKFNGGMNITHSQDILSSDNLMLMVQSTASRVTTERLSGAGGCAVTFYFSNVEKLCSENIYFY